MNISSKLLEIINNLEQAINYEDWDKVDSCVDELHFIYEEMESTYIQDEYDDFQ